MAASSRRRAAVCDRARRWARQPCASSAMLAASACNSSRSVAASHGSSSADGPKLQVAGCSLPLKLSATCDWGITSVGGPPHFGVGTRRDRLDLGGVEYRSAVQSESGFEIEPVYTAGCARRLGRREPSSARRASTPTPAGSTPRCTPAGRGRCGSTPASAPRASPTSATTSWSPTARPACRSPSTCRPRWATTPTRRSRTARSARSASRSTRSTTCGCCSTGSRWTRSRPR